MRYRLFTKKAIQAFQPPITKGELISKAIGSGTTFDYALPQPTLDAFVLESGFNYDFVLMTSVFVYDDQYRGMFSACFEVQNEIIKLGYCKESI